MKLRRWLARYFTARKTVARKGATAIGLVLIAACSHRDRGPAVAKAAESSSASPVLITMFYAYPANPPAGEKVSLCYGVENATGVRIEPAVESVWPSISRCFEVPSKAQTYTLTAERGGERVSQSVTIGLAPPSVKILEVSINKLDFTSGEQATVCYKAKNAAGVTIEPGAWIEPHRPDLGCIQDRPHQTTTYTVTATGAGGDIDSERVTARVSRKP